jgi:uncharacterized protein YjdB
VRRLFVNNSIVVRLVGLLAVMSLGMVSIVGSGGGQDITGGGVTITSITVTPSAVPDGLPVDLKMQFTATAAYSDNTTGDVTGAVTWSSSNTSVATISVVGLATGVAVGTTNITATMSGVTSNAVSLEVISISLTKIEISPAIMPNDLPLGIDQQFTALGTFNNYKSYDITNLVNWNSSNLNAATIGSNTGMLTSVAPATTSVTASAFGQTSNAVSVTVVDNKTAEQLIVEPQWIGALPVNRTYQLKALIRYSDNSTYDVSDRVTWSSNDPSIATVNNNSNIGPKGLVTAVSTGDFTTRQVGILVNDSPYTILEGSSTIEVTAATITSVSIEASSSDDLDSLPIGYTRDFTATGHFSDGSTLQLSNPESWTLNNPTIASFNQTGEIATLQGVAPGSVTITYVDKLADNSTSGVVGTVTLLVADVSLTGVSVTPVSDILPVEAKAQFSADGTFTGGLLRDITNDVVWNSTVSSVGVFGSDRGLLTSLAVNSTNVVALGLNSTGDPVSSLAAPVTVQNVSLQTLEIVTEPGTVFAGGTKEYDAIATFDNSVTADYTERAYWTSSNVEIATVSNVNGTKGQVTFIKAGQVTLNAIVSGTSTSATPFVVNVQ